MHLNSPMETSRFTWRNSANKRGVTRIDRGQWYEPNNDMVLVLEPRTATAPAPIALISDSEYDTHELSEICDLFCLGHLFTSTVVAAIMEPWNKTENIFERESLNSPWFSTRILRFCPRLICKGMEKAPSDLDRTPLNLNRGLGWESGGQGQWHPLEGHRRGDWGGGTGEGDWGGRKTGE